MSAMPSLPDRLVNYLTHVDYLDRYALVATEDDEIVGVARFERTGRDRAEVAIVVADELQGKGLGTELLTRLAGVARRRGIALFEGEVLGLNTQMIDLVRHLGGDVVTELTEEAVLADLTYPSAPPGASEVRKVEIPIARGGMRRLVKALALSQSVLLPPRGMRAHIPGIGRLYRSDT